MKIAPLAILVLTTALSHIPIAYAQKAVTDPGKQEFEANCGVCHGMDAKGNGVLGASLKTVPPDLTLLAKNNGGVFPADRISSVIDGRAQVATHGTREMPIWGSRYAVNVGEHYADAEAFVRGRVLLLVDYLNRVQQIKSGHTGQRMCTARSHGSLFPAACFRDLFCERLDAM